MKRRTFVLGAVGAVATLGVGWSLLPPRQRLRGAPLPTGAGEVAMNGWVKIGTDDHVTVMMAKSEMGQGVHTTLAMILADELDADWSHVRIEMAPIDHIYGNIATVIDGLPFHPGDRGMVQRTTAWLTAKTMREAGVMLTGGSSSIKDLWLPMRQAGASARAALVAAAAQRWSVPAGELTVERGVVQHAATQRRARFGELVTTAAALPLDEHAPLKQPGQFRLIGTAVPRMEAADKVRGAATFGIDVRPAGLLHASVVMSPRLGGTVASVNDAAAKAMPGVHRVARFDGIMGGAAGVAVIGDTRWQAMQAARALQVQWNAGPGANFASDAGRLSLRESLDGDDDGHAFLARGDIDAALAASARRVTANYEVPWLAHAAMEPINCTVQVQEGRATVWAPTQVPDLARLAAARALNLDASNVTVHVTLLGGGFGRRLDVDFIAQAAQVARHANGAPVQVLWTREQDMRHDFYRPACAAAFTAGLDATGAVTAWRVRTAGQSPVNAMLHRLFNTPSFPLDKTTSEGSFDQPYEFPAARVAHRTIDLPVPVGFWRSVGHSHQAFFTESFLDEMARAATADPVAFRAALLQRHPRHLRVLQRVADLSAWRTTPQSGVRDGVRTGRGVALHQSFGAVVAQVADVAVASDGALRVERVHCVVDCGFPVHPDVIRQQMEGGILFGLSAALLGEITIRDGQVQQGNFDSYPQLRMTDRPEVMVDILPSTAHPEGVGEPAVPPIAPAVANAIFAATGQRLRALPLRIAAAPEAPSSAPRAEP